MIKNYIAPTFDKVFRRVVRLTAQGVTDAVAGLVKQGMWVELNDGSVQLPSTDPIATILGGVVFDAKPSFNGSFYPENLTIIQTPGFVFEIDNEAYDDAATWVEGAGVTASGATGKKGMFTPADRGDAVVAVVERAPHSGLLTLMLHSEIYTYYDNPYLP